MLYEIHGTVIKGRGKGHLFGLPTANISTSDKLPKLGVYAGYTYVKQGKYKSVINIGTRPSADNDSDITIETMLLDFSGDLYGQNIKVELVEYLRGIVKFEDGLIGVKRQINIDEAKAREILK